jgi:hypothetical protein
MTVRMKQHAVFGTVGTAMRAPHKMMAMPAGQWRDALLTDRTEAVWRLPQATQVASSPQVARHTHAQTGGAVWLPRRVLRMGCALHLRGPTNRYTGGAAQAHVLLRPLRRRAVTKAPPGMTGFGSAILIPNPVARCAWVSAPRPLPQQGKDLRGYSRKGPLARPMRRLLCPTPHHRIQLYDQGPRDGLLVTRHDPADGVEERPHVFLGGCA